MLTTECQLLSALFDLALRWACTHAAHQRPRPQALLLCGLPNLLKGLGANVRLEQARIEVTRPDAHPLRMRAKKEKKEEEEEKEENADADADADDGDDDDNDGDDDDNDGDDDDNDGDDDDYEHEQTDFFS